MNVLSCHYYPLTIANVVSASTDHSHGGLAGSKKRLHSTNPQILPFAKLAMPKNDLFGDLPEAICEVAESLVGKKRKDASDSSLPVKEVQEHTEPTKKKSKAGN